MYTRLPVWAPSPVADPLFREVPKAVDRARDRRDRRRLRAGRRALRRGRLRRHRAAVLALARSCAASCRRPRTERTDEYGGSLDNRARLLLEIVAAVRDGDRRRPGARRAALRRRADRGRHHHRRGRRGRPAWSRPPGHVDYINTSIGVATATPVHDRGVDARPAGLRAVHPVGDPQGGRPAGRRRRPVQGPAAGRAGAGRGPLRPRRRRARARSPTPTSPPRRAPAPPTTSGCACRATRSASGGWASTAGSAASRTRAPAGRRVGRRRRAPAAPPQRWWSSAAGPAGLQAAIAAAAQRPRVDRATSATTEPAARCGWPRRCRTGPSSATSSATSWPSAGGSASTIELRRRASTAAAVVAERPDARRSWPPAPSRPGRGGRRPTPSDVVDVRDVLDGTRRAGAATVRGRRRDRLPPGHVGGRAARRPRLRGRGRHARAWSSARTSASPSTWRTGGCGRRPRASCRRPTSCRWASTAGDAARCCTTRPAQTSSARADWVVLRRARRTRSSGCTTSCRRAPASSVAPRRRLRRAAPGPRRGRSRASASGRRCDRGRCRRAATACCRAGARRGAWPRRRPRRSLVGRRARPPRPRHCAGRDRRARALGAGGFAPGGWAAALAAACCDVRRSSCCRPRPTGVTWRPGSPPRSAGRCSPAPSRSTPTRRRSCARAGGLRRSRTHAVDGPSSPRCSPACAASTASTRAPTITRRSTLRGRPSDRATPSVLEVLPPDPATMDLGRGAAHRRGGAGLGGPGAVRAAAARSPPALGASLRRHPGRRPTPAGWPRPPDRHDRRRRRPAAVRRVRHLRRGAAHRAASATPTTSSA